MHAFIITAQNQPGELARVLDGIAQRGVNVTAGGATTWGEGGAIAIQVNDDDGARSALQEAGITFREADVAAAWLENTPGTLADAARRLGDAGVNIEAFFLIGMEGGKVGILFAVSDGAAAKAALGDLVGAASG
jgi:hypothetical protein